MKNSLCAAIFLAVCFSFCDLNCVQSLPPSPKPGYVPVVLENNTSIQSSDVYFLSHGLDDSGIPCYLVPNSDGVCEYVYPNASGSPSSASAQISKTLDTLPRASGISPDVKGDARLVYLPLNSGSRAYLSLGKPLYLPTIFNPAPQRQVLDIGDCAPQSINDPNYYTLYQDFEMGLVNYSGSQNTTATLASTFFLNLSYVDYFCLPMQLKVYSYPSNVSNNAQPVSGSQNTLSGSQKTLSRDQIITNLKSNLNGDWNSLLLPFYSDPYISGTLSGYTRVLSAKNSIAQATGAQYVEYANSPSFFPLDYVSNINSGPQSQLSFFGALAYYLQAKPFYIQIFPAGIPLATVYEVIALEGNTLLFNAYQSTDSSFNLSRNSALDTTLSLWINSTANPTPSDTELTTELLLSGSLWPFSPPIGVNYTNELSKAISALFSIGQLPLDTSQGPNVGTSTTNPFVVSSYQSPSFEGGFYSFNPSGTPTNTYFVGPTASGFVTQLSSGPWYNLYDQILHQDLIIPSPSSVPPYSKNPSYGLGYAYDYDDLLNLAGLVAAPVQDQYAQSYTDSNDPTQNQPYVVVTVSGITSDDVKSLSIDNDSFTGSLYVIGSNNGVQAVLSYYDQNKTKQTLNFAELAAQTTTTKIVEVNQTSSQPVTLTFTYGGVNYVYDVNLTRQIVLPSSAENAYSSIDQTFIEGVSFSDPENNQNPPINPRRGSPFLQIQLNTSPPGWAG